MYNLSLPNLMCYSTSCLRPCNCSACCRNHWVNDPNDLTGMTAILYCMVPYIAACVDVSWNGIFWDHSVLLLPANEVWGKVILSVACVKNSVHRGEYLGRYTPQAGTPPLCRYSPVGTPPSPQSSACWEIWATSGWYASYWNAFLFHVDLWQVETLHSMFKQGALYTIISA